MKSTESDVCHFEVSVAVVGLEVTTEGIRTGTGTERWRERVPDYMACNAEAASAK